MEHFMNIQDSCHKQISGSLSEVCALWELGYSSFFSYSVSPDPPFENQPILMVLVRYTTYRGNLSSSSICLYLT